MYPTKKMVLAYYKKEHCIYKFQHCYVINYMYLPCFVNHGYRILFIL
jgi:hypothetical protein